MQGLCRLLLGPGVALGLSASLLLAPFPSRADDTDQLGGDYFVGASVFLFQRTVLIPFAPAGVNDSMLDAGVIVEAHDNAADEDGAVALDAIAGWLAASAYGQPPSGESAAEADPVPALNQERRRA